MVKAGDLPKLVGASDGGVDVSNQMLISRLQISLAERGNISDLLT